MWTLDPRNSPELIAALRPHWRQPAADVAWVGEGWRDLVWDCHRQVAARFPSYELLNVKQKWGWLSFQALPASGGEDAPAWGQEELAELEAIVEAVAYQARTTCEFCGGQGRLRDARKMELTLCAECDRRFSDPPRPGHD